MAIPVSVRGDMVEQGSTKQPKDLECQPYAYQLAGATVQQHIAQHESAAAHRYPEKPDDFPQGVVSDTSSWIACDVLSVQSGGVNIDGSGRPGVVK
jgi:ABC-type dipeptide/oligopeptide/nickel transport system ATPase component